MGISKRELAQLQNNLKRPKKKETFENGKIWLSGTPRVMKNNKRISSNGKGKKASVRHSEAFEAYLSILKPQLIKNYNRWYKLTNGLPKPLHLAFQFVMDKRITFDYGNMQEGILDAMTGQAYKKHTDFPQKFAWLEDDTYKDVVLWPTPVLHNKDNPGVWVVVLYSIPQYQVHKFWVK